MTLLVDTHALAWWVLDDPRLSIRAREAIAAIDNEVHVSVVSAFEMSTKFRIGKWPEIGEFVKSFQMAVQAEGFSLIEMSIDHAVLAGLMPGEHRDPFDRLLAAQAHIHKMTLVTNDNAFGGFPVTLLW